MLAGGEPGLCLMPQRPGSRLHEHPASQATAADQPPPAGAERSDISSADRTARGGVTEHQGRVSGHRKAAHEADPGSGRDAGCDYAELHCLSNFSFLRGASHPEELVERAAELGYAALAITDRNSLAGVVRAHVAAKELGLHLIVGAEITPVAEPSDGSTLENRPTAIRAPAHAPAVVLLAPDRRAYGCLARLITRGRLRVKKGDCAIRLADIAERCSGSGLIALVLPDLDPSIPSTATARSSAATFISRPS